MGVQPGDRVALYLKNSVEAVLSIFAIHKAGAVFVIVNPEIKSEKLTYLLANSGAKVLITSNHKMPGIQSILRLLPELDIVFVTGNKRGGFDIGSRGPVWWDDIFAEHSEGIQPPPKNRIDIDLAALIYTSGSTGNPKGAMM